MKANLPEAVSLYAEIAGVILPGNSFKSDLSAAEACVDYFMELPGKLGLQTRLGEMGLTTEDVPDLVRDGIGQERLLSYNIKELTETEIEQIYRNSL
jgi:alcohol dehydrogenase class IV